MAEQSPRPEKRLRFPKSARLLQRGEFQRAYQKGRRRVGESMALFCVASEPPPPGQPPPPSRLGVCASKKTGKACRRNRAKRLVREAWRLLRPELKPGFEVVVNCRSRLCESGLAETSAELRALCASLGLLPAPAKPPKPAAVFSAPPKPEPEPRPEPGHAADLTEA